MKKGLAVAASVAVAFALVLWVASWFRNEDAVKGSAAKAWPAGMGTLDTAAERLPAMKANGASVRLAALGKALPKNDAIDAYVSHEIARGELTIGRPPALPDVSAIRDLLLHEPVVWERAEGIGGDQETQARRTLQMTAARALVAGALAKANANDAAAWDDLHAVWNLALSLDGHPQVMVQTAALSMARMITAVAWKMPLPAPAWLAEVHSRDRVKPLLEAFQFQTASYSEDGLRIFPTKMLADSLEHDRAIAEELARETRCDVTPRANEIGVDLTTVWHRAFRYRAEREATANALRVREGKPVETKSQCSDGAWTFDGSALRFSREIATAPSDKAMPLTLRVTSGG